MYQRRNFIKILLSIQCLALFAADLLQASHYDDDISFCELSPKLEAAKTIDQLDDKGLFRAAVFEHRRVDLKDPKASVEANLAIYEKVTKIASENGAKILVLPEDGIFVADYVDYIESLVEEVPNPDSLNGDNNNPCNQPELYAKAMPILSKLSCLAKENNIYLVANYGTQMHCEPKIQVNDTKCPDNGRFLFNTNVVFDSSGNYIKRYRKYNLFVEVFDRAPAIEHVYFDTPFGRFGLMTCFDMMFAKPAIDLIEKFNINTMLFPTWWFDEVPFLAATQFQDGWSWTNNINLLASNVHILAKGSVGSSISSGNYSISTSPADFQPKLLLANLPKQGPAALSSSLLPTGLTSIDEFDAKSIDISDDKKPNEDIYKRTNFMLLSSDSLYQLRGYEGSKTQCVKTLCCTVHYTLADDTPEDMIERLFVVVRDGLRRGHFMWYEQICALATLEGDDIYVDKKNATKYTLGGFAKFKSLALHGTFKGRYVYPITARNVSEPVPRPERRFSCDLIGPSNLGVYSCELVYSGGQGERVSTFGMYGRVYERDQIDYSHNTRHIKQIVSNTSDQDDDS